MPYIFCFPISIATIMDNKCETNLNSELFPPSPTCNVPGAALQLRRLKISSGVKGGPWSRFDMNLFRTLLFMIVDRI